MTFYHRTSKYSGWYFAIIEKAKSQQRSKKNGYFENHHVHPECFGGKKTKDNMVLLTAREHIICHRLLIRMFKPKTKKWTSMVFAFKRMIDAGAKHQGERQSVINSRHLEERRRLHGQAMSIRMKGKKMPDHVKDAISKANTGRTLSDEHRAAIGASLRKTLAMPEQKAKISAERSTRRLTPEQRLVRAESVRQIWARRMAGELPMPVKRN